MNLKFVVKIISRLLLIISFFLLIPLALAFYYGESEVTHAIGLTVLISLVIFGIVSLLFKNLKEKSLSTRDGFVFVTFSWISVSLIGALPFYLSGAMPSYVDAYFETISGFTTTGASVLTNIEALPKSLLFWRSLTHWLGGMGIVVLSVALLPLMGIGGLQIVKAEAPGPTVDKITPRIKETAKILWFIYVGFTVVETALLMLGGMDLFNALTNTFGTLATGGFCPKNTSVAYYNSAYIDIVMTIFMVLAGVNFGLHFRFLMGKGEHLLRDSEFKAYFLIFALATFFVTLNLYMTNKYESVFESFRFAGFQVASILTTTGFATADYELWPHFSQTILFLLMFVGGCSGSTGGGIKVVRLVALLKQGINEMKYLMHPRGVFTLKMSNVPIKKDIIYAISGFFFLYILMLLLTTVVVSTSNQDVLTSFTTALATVGNIGPGFGRVGPTENYSFYPAYVKSFLCFAMLVGRLELYTVLILFSRKFWTR